MRPNLYQRLFILLALVTGSYTSFGQNAFKLSNISPYFVSPGDTFTVSASHIDTSNTSYELRWGAMKLPIIGLTDSSITAVTPHTIFNDFVYLFDSASAIMAVSSHPLFANYNDTSAQYKSRPQDMIDETDPKVIWDSTSSYIYNYQDLNGDGKIDIMLQRNNNIYLLFNKTTSKWEIDFDTLALTGVNIYDRFELNGQSLPELVFYQGSDFAVYELAFNGTNYYFSDTTLIPYSSGVEWVDANNDGLLDYLFPYWNYPAQKNEMGIRHNLSTDTLDFDTIRYVQADSLENFQLIEYSDSGTAILACKKKGIGLVAIELAYDTGTYTLKELAQISYSSSFNYFKTFDLDFDGRKEVIIGTNNNSYVYGFNDTSFSSLGSFEGYPGKLGFRETLVTDTVSSFYRPIKTSSYYLPRLQKININSASLNSQYTDTLNYRYDNSLFTDFNGDGFVDLFSHKYLRVYPSKVFNLNTISGSDTINFLQDIAGQVILDSFNFITNEGLEAVQIDSITTNGTTLVTSSDTTPISFPITLYPQEKLPYALRYADTSNYTIEQVTIHTRYGTHQGPIIRGKINTNPSFEVISVSPNTYRPGDTLSVILSNYRGNIDSTYTFFGAQKAEIVNLNGDTLFLIAPNYYDQQYLLVMDKVNKLVAQSKETYSMTFYDHKGLDFDVYTFRQNSAILDKISSSGFLQMDFLNNEPIARTFNSGNTSIYRFFNEEKLTFAGQIAQYFYDAVPITFDDEIDYFSGTSYAVFLQNTGNKTDSLPVQLDTLTTLNYNSSLLHYADLDNDGLRDVVMYNSQTKQLDIHSAQFKNSPFEFSLNYSLSTLIPKQTYIKDMTGDGLPDIILFNDTTIVLLQNRSRKGQLYFKEISRLARPFQHNLFRIMDIAEAQTETGLLVLDGYQSNVFLHHLFFKNDSLKLDSIAAHNLTGYTSVSGKFVDIDANGTLDVALTHHLLSNRSDTSGFSFILSDRITRISSDFLDFNGDHLIDFYSNGYVYLNQMRKPETWSELEKAKNEATVPFPNYDVSEPVILRSQDTASFSFTSSIWLANAGLVKTALTAVEIPAHIQVSASPNFTTLSLPIQIDTGSQVELYIRSNNQVYDSNYTDTLKFTYDRNDIIDFQEVIHVYTEYPIIDSIRPLAVRPGDTLTIYGKNLVNNRGKTNLVRIYDRKMDVLYASDSIYKVKMPNRHSGGYITLTDTLNRLGAQSGSAVSLLRDGPGTTINAAFFELDTLYTGKDLSGWNQANKPHYRVEFADLNDDGNMDLYGHIDHWNGSSSWQTGNLLFDKDSDYTDFDWSYDLQMAYGADGYSTFPKFLSSYIHDMNLDGQLDVLAIDAGGLCTPGSYVCAGATLQTPKTDKGYAQLYSESEAYYYTGRYDKRIGAADAMHDFDRNGMPDVMWQSDNYYFATFSDYYTFRLDSTNNQKIVSLWDFDTLSRPTNLGSDFDVADMDGDGLIDIIDGGRIFLNQSVPDSFAFVAAYDLIDSFNYCGSGGTTSRNLALQVVDLNGDNKPDLIGAGPTLCGGCGHKVWYINKSTPGNLSFISDTFSVYGACYLFSAFGDLNGDGLTDLIAMDPAFSTSGDDSVYIYTNKTDSVFKYELNAIYLKEPQSATLYDIDGDNDEDLLLIGFENNRHVFKHYLNTPLRAELSNNSIELETAVTSSDSSTIWFKNTGALAITIDTISISGNNSSLQFTSSTGQSNQTLNPGDSISLKFVHHGDSIGNYKDTVILKHNADKREHFVYINATTLPSALLATLSDTIQFNPARVGSSTEFKLKIKNIGSDTLVLGTNYSPTSIFSIQNTQNIAIYPGDSDEISVTFRPSDTIFYNTNATINHNAVGNALSLYLSGTGLAPRIADTIAYSAGSIAYRTVQKDTVFLVNTGTDTLHISGIDTSNYLMLIDFTIAIPPADSGMVVFQSHFQNPGNYNTSLTAHHDYFIDSTTSINVQFTGLRGKLDVASGLGFNRTKIDSTKTNTLYLVNSGNDSLRLDSISFATSQNYNFANSMSFPFSIGASDTQAIEIRFTPNSHGVFIGECLLYCSDSTSEYSIKLDGCTPVNFDSVSVDSTKSLDYKLYNQTRTTIQIASTKIFPGNIFTLGTFPTTAVASKDSTNLAINFTPLTEGLTTAQAEFRWNSDTTFCDISGFGKSPVVETNRIIYLKPYSYRSNRHRHYLCKKHGFGYTVHSTICHNKQNKDYR